MKRIIIIATLLLASISTFAQNGKSIYQKYSDAENVSAVYISPAMFRLIGKIPDMNVEGNDVNLAPIIRSLSGLYIISSENPHINANLMIYRVLRISYNKIRTIPITTTSQNPED